MALKGSGEGSTGLRAMITLAFLCFSLPASAKSTVVPPWVSSRPIDPAYYIGIASAPKSAEGNQSEAAKLKALAALASEISVQITSQIRQKVEEAGASVSQSYQAEIQALTRAHLEGYDIVATWESDKEYWMYLRLSKQDYRLLQERKRQAALEKAEALRKSAESALGERRPAVAVQSLLLAIVEVEAAEGIWAASGAPPAKAAKGELETLLRNVLESMEITVPKQERKGFRGRELRAPLEMKARYATKSGGSYPIADLPMVFSFLKGSGHLLPKTRTDTLGFARTKVSSITSREPLQVISAGIDCESLLGLDSLTPFLARTLRTLPFPTAVFEVSVGAQQVYLRSAETNLEEPLKIPLLEAAIKKTLSKEGFRFTLDSVAADLWVALESHSRKGSAVGNLYFTFVDLSFSVRDNATGQEVFKTASSGIKGGHLDYQRAGLKAYQQAAGLLESEIVPQALRAMRL